MININLSFEAKCLILSIIFGIILGLTIATVVVAF